MNPGLLLLRYSSNESASQLSPNGVGRHSAANLATLTVMDDVDRRPSSAQDDPDEAIQQSNASNTSPDWPPRLVPGGASSAAWADASIAVSCALIAAGTVGGNVLVCMAVAIVRKLQTPSNLLIVSLAVADLLVAMLVMPPAAAYEVLGRWPFGSVVCDAWTSLDVFLCTASILNLCTISVDRYLVITRPLQYAVRRTPGRMALMVAGVWISAALISVPPQLFGWRADSTSIINADEDADEDGCLISQDLGYQIYATVGAFYLPLGVMAFIYYRIYMVSARIVEAEARSQQLAQPAVCGGGGVGPRSRRSTSAESNASLQKTVMNIRSNVTLSTGGRATPTATTRCMSGLRRMFFCISADRQPETDAKQQRDSIALRLLINDGASNNDGYHIGTGQNRRFRFLTTSSLNRISSSRERKATKTLGVIMGCFTVCWLPFFILALVKAFACSDSATCVVPHWLEGIFLWLGYTNSFLNPIIYARFNRDFRTPFRQILACRCRGINLRMRSESYADQYGAVLPASGDLLHTQPGAPGGGYAARHSSRGSRLSVDTVVHYQSCTNRPTNTVGILRPPSTTNCVTVATSSPKSPKSRRDGSDDESTLGRRLQNDVTVA